MTDDDIVFEPKMSAYALARRRAGIRRQPDEGPEVRLWRIWCNMRHRCSDKGADTAQMNYAHRGITVCDAWLDYRVFAEWANGAGYSDALSLDRIDNDDGYRPDNCRWTTSFIQARNTRRNLIVEHEGERMSFAEAVERVGMSYDWAYNRFRRGRSFEDIAREFRAL